MAKIRIEQIKDLTLTPSAEGTTRSLTIGTGNTITPLAEVAVAEVENNVITALTQSGNNLTATRKTFADIVASGLKVEGTGTGVVTSLSFTDSTITANLTSNESSQAASDLTVLAGYTQDATGKITSVATKTFGADFKETEGVISLAKTFITSISDNPSDEELPTEKAVKTYVDDQVQDAIEATTYTQGNGIAISDDNVISAVVKEGDKVLSVDANGISSTLSLYYDTNNKKIQLLGKESAEIAYIDATDFIKDGMLSTAEIVKGKWSADGKTFTEIEGGADSAIKLVWNTDAGKEPMYINSETLVDAYTAGNTGIVIDPNSNTISHKAGAENLTTESKGSVGPGVEGTEYVFSVPTVKVDEFGHVIELSDNSVTINVASTITDAASKKVATEGAVKSYVDEQVSAVKVPFHITEKITATTDKQTTLKLQKAPYNNQAVVYQNGLCVIGEYEVKGTIITLTLEVPAQVDDVFTVDYEA